ncbi:sodium/glutamate symporter [Sporosarcina sp. P37]|uniref:sodium/glutamate symporter n=1 Tax=unclassified Sporosarcina TaxID=2647733 RepID=UPI0009BDC736|nr:MULTISPECIES: sodium/glutamate symporter [unclassified Sporosarcina]ARD48544.1 sodium:glutamate symporter [Sporosarcina sp. P33]ARK25052.1 sodium/glutamate symporter [Sporosarcina sp. P37]PID18195.1 sodium/glutamate symporter [Sporosarcina sp. P35]
MTIELNQITTLFLALALLTLGTMLVRKIGFLQKFCIPAPVVGGLLFAILATILKYFDLLSFTLDTSLQNLFMLTFFTTVGLGASFRLIRLGGKLLIIYWVACGFLALAQNVIGVSMSYLFNLHPLIGMMAGAVSMEGGHGGATAYGQTLQELGIDSALSIGIAAATFGLVAGGLVGGPIVKYLINKYDLKSTEVEHEEAYSVESLEKPINTDNFIIQTLLITLCIAGGTFIGDLFSNATGFVMPGYVGAMFVAVIVRNIVDRVKEDAVHMTSINLIGDVSLGIFLSMALMSIKLWEVADLALPLLVIVFVQVLFVVLFAIFVLFRILGKDYDAAVMIAGFAGHGLGATPNAMANMAAVTARYGPSRKAFLIVPIVGAFLIDVVSMPIIITTINIFT